MEFIYDKDLILSEEEIIIISEDYFIKADESEDEPDEDETNEQAFTDMFLNDGFIDSFKSQIKQYVSETNLTDNYNSFAIIPYLEILFEDETYGFNTEFESAVVINIDKEGKVIESDIPDVDTIKYQTPVMEELVNMENEVSKDAIGVFVKEALEDIKEVPR